MTNLLTAVLSIGATAALIGALAYRRIRNREYRQVEKYERELGVEFWRGVNMRPRRADHVWLDITENLN